LATCRNSWVTTATAAIVAVVTAYVAVIVVTVRSVDFASEAGSSLSTSFASR
jgi:hypothetical protein